MNSEQFIYLDCGAGTRQAKLMLRDLWPMVLTNNAIRWFHGKANTNRNQHRITRKKVHFCMFAFGPLLRIMHVVSSLASLGCVRPFRGRNV